MLAVTRFNGTVLWINPDLLLSVEATPDTVLTFTTGDKCVIKESVEALNAAILSAKRQIFQP